MCELFKHGCVLQGIVEVHPRRNNRGVAGEEESELVNKDYLWGWRSLSAQEESWIVKITMHFLYPCPTAAKQVNEQNQGQVSRRC